MDTRLKKLLSKKVREVRAAPNWFKTSFAAQTKFIKDPARLKAGHCTRRAGKSYGCGIYMCKEAWENPGVSVLYVGLTRKTAERIMWKDILKKINREMKLGAKFSDADLKMTFPNGSVIYLEGADASSDSMDKFLGQKLKLVIVDEASKFRINVEKLLFDVLKPALADYEGSLVMIGTASDIVSSYFARVTRGQVEGWSIHRWSAENNPHMRRQFRAEIKQLKENNPEVEKEAWFRQNYMGEWVVDTRKLIYQYDPNKTFIQAVPDMPDWSYCLGITLSYSGRSAFSIVGYSERSRSAYVVETLTYEDASVLRAVETTLKLRDYYDIGSIIVADASEKLVDELRRRFGLAVTAAPDKDKAALIRLFTTDLRNGNIKLVQGDHPDLTDEWDSIIMDARSSKVLREHPLCRNQLATATLYAWQKSAHYTYKPTRNYDDPMDRHWEAIEEKLDNGPESDDFTDFYGVPGDPL